MCIFRNGLYVYVCSCIDRCVHICPTYMCAHMYVRVCSTSYTSYRNRSVHASCFSVNLSWRLLCIRPDSPALLFVCVLVVGIQVPSCMYPASLPVHISPGFATVNTAVWNVAPCRPVEHVLAHVSGHWSERTPGGGTASQRDPPWQC